VKTQCKLNLANLWFHIRTPYLRNQSKRQSKNVFPYLFVFSKSKAKQNCKFRIFYFITFSDKSQESTLPNVEASSTPTGIQATELTSASIIAIANKSKKMN